MLPVESPMEIAASGDATASDSQPPALPHHLGHRERLRARFLGPGPDGLQDYELLELLLFSVIPRRDVKPLAKDLLTHFGSLWQVVMASPQRLRNAFGLSDTVIATLTVTGAIALRGMRQRVMDRPVLSRWDDLLEYCRAAMAHEAVEQFRLLFLDKRHALIADEIQQKGTVDRAPAYPREVVRRALDLGATAIILVHNHPSGDPSPSRDDITLTKDITAAAKVLGIIVHDHLVVGAERTVSFKSLGLLE